MPIEQDACESKPDCRERRAQQDCEQQKLIHTHVKHDECADAVEQGDQHHADGLQRDADAVIADHGQQHAVLLGLMPDGTGKIDLRELHAEAGEDRKHAEREGQPIFGAEIGEPIEGIGQQIRPVEVQDHEPHAADAQQAGDGHRDERNEELREDQTAGRDRKGEHQIALLAQQPLIKPRNADDDGENARTGEAEVIGRGQRDFKTVDGAARLGKKTEDHGRQGKENNSRPNEQENLQIRAKIVF